MQVCKKIIFVSAVSLFFEFGYAQETGISSVSSPQMPTVSSPTIGGGFYIPGNSRNAPYTGQKPGADAKKTETKNSVAAEEKKSIEESLVNEDEMQIAEDIAEAASSLTEKERAALLKTIQNSKKTAPVSRENQNYYSGAEESKGSHILRFSVNGNDLLKTCHSVYISDLQQDGTFLITGERRYKTSGKVQSETFYIRFTATPQRADLKNYVASAEVMQPSEDENSVLYQMSQRTDLEANRTGNLVTMRTSDPDWKLDMLIDLGVNN